METVFASFAVNNQICWEFREQVLKLVMETEDVEAISVNPVFSGYDFALLLRGAKSPIAAIMFELQSQPRIWEEQMKLNKVTPIKSSIHSLDFTESSFEIQELGKTGSSVEAYVLATLSKPEHVVPFINSIKPGIANEALWSAISKDKHTVVSCLRTKDIHRLGEIVLGVFQAQQHVVRTETLQVIKNSALHRHEEGKGEEKAPASNLTLKQKVLIFIGDHGNPPRGVRRKTLMDKVGVSAATLVTYPKVKEGWFEGLQQEGRQDLRLTPKGYEEYLNLRQDEPELRPDGSGFESNSDSNLVNMSFKKR